ncbi:RNA-guided endonuclease TnpB family protein [Acetilactobacillus jinshanensis]|uniref:Transposase n=1 Tax=Acetilactobacillus jinshanensis TaxID=1720083 RepID=A0A4P6ZL42_9LACO|nr:RNA-guided endonuclease TnpB family protein [Acetilactobacillus jinshanensis]QBP18506.1 transposase [Acetilactobacillus jinshanensis]URL61377.1 IS200/IS605 family element transposase accessory protein TnpB [uncultured bacterium]
MLITKGIKAKLYPNQYQQTWLNQQLGDIRFIWNHFLAIEKAKWLSYADSRSLQCELGILYQSYQNLFQHRSKAPKFKSKKYYKQSYRTTSIPKQINKPHVLKLAKLGYMKVHFNQPLVGKIKQVTVTHDSTGDYVASLTVEYENQVSLPKTNQAIGIDVGLSNLAILSTDMKWNFKYYNKANEARKHKWQILSARRRRDAIKDIRYNQHLQKKMPNHHVKTLVEYHNYQKAKREVAKINRHIKNQRINYLQILTTWLVKHYDFIAIEDLKVSNMQHNHRLARAIACASWYHFRTLLAYKCVWYGKHLELVNPKDTSRICHTCGKNTGVKPLDIRSFVCQYCHTKQDRDVNASINILHLGLEQAMANNSTSVQDTSLQLCVE